MDIQPSTSNADAFDDSDDDHSLQIKAPSILRSSSISPTPRYKKNGSVHTSQSPPAMYSFDSWNKLRELAVEVVRSERRVSELRSELDDRLQLSLENRRLASMKQNSEIHNARLRSKVISMQQKLQHRRVGKGLVDLANTDREVTSDLDSAIEELREQINEKEKEISKIFSHLCVYRALLVHRRKQMLSDALSIFRLKVGVHTSSPNCSCANKDFISGIHLPHTTMLQGHDDISLSAGLGNVIHLLSVCSVVCDYPFRYHLESGIYPKAYIPVSGKSFSISGQRGKEERRKLDEMTVLLGRNIAQFRSDCGLHTAKMERTIPALSHILLLLSSGSSVEIVHAAFDRPFHSSYSVASLMPSECILLEREDLIEPFPARSHTFDSISNFAYGEDVADSL